MTGPEIVCLCILIFWLIVTALIVKKK